MALKHLRSVAISCLITVGLLVAMLGQAASVGAQQAPITCTEVIGFSQTDQWYEGGFIQSVANPGNWQLRWYSGGSVDLWADPNSAAWSSSSRVGQCSQNSGAPDRIVFQVSGEYTPDPNW